MNDPFMQLANARRSSRAFLATAVGADELRQLLATARQAPSGANLQPGAFIQVRGEVRERLSADLETRWRDGLEEPGDYGYFPQPMPMQLRKRQVEAAQALYGALGVARGDRPGRDEQFARNFRFFDAPVALVVTIDREFGSGGYMDLGMALYGLMLAAQSRGLASCAIGALAAYPRVVRRHLGLDESTHVVCGIALGHPDPCAPVNDTQTTRCDVDDYFRCLG